MDRITEETTFLCKKKINTIEDLENYESEISNKIEKLVKERRCLYNKVKRCRNLERKEMIQKDIETISKEIKDYRNKYRNDRPQKSIVIRSTKNRPNTHNYSTDNCGR